RERESLHGTLASNGLGHRGSCIAQAGTRPVDIESVPIEVLKETNGGLPHRFAATIVTSLDAAGLCAGGDDRVDPDTDVGVAAGPSHSRRFSQRRESLVESPEAGSH